MRQNGKSGKSEKEKCARKDRRRAPGEETNDPVSRCAKVIKSRQIFSLSRRVSDTYIILKGAISRALYPGETSPIPSFCARESPRDGRVFRVAAMSPHKCVRGLSRAISPVRLHLRFVLRALCRYYCARPSPPFIILFHPFMSTHRRSRRSYRGSEGRALFTSANATSVLCAARVSSLRVRHVRTSRNPA